MRIASLTILCLALAVLPALAQTELYNNGPINGTTDAWTINFGYVVSDTFTCCNGNQDFSVEDIHFGVWEFPGDQMTAVDWSITAGENGGTVYGSGHGAGLTDTFVSTNQYGYDIDTIWVKFSNIDLQPGTYWLNLANASVPSGDPVYWDENSGPSKASESSVGTIPSEAFTITGTPTSGTTPEPSSIMLFGSGALGLAGLLRRKLF